MEKEKIFNCLSIQTVKVLALPLFLYKLSLSLAVILLFRKKLYF